MRFDVVEINRDGKEHLLKSSYHADYTPIKNYVLVNIRAINNVIVVLVRKSEEK